MDKETEKIQQLTSPVSQPVEPHSAKLVLTLGIAGFLSGCVLVAVYIFTLPLIENNKNEALKSAVFKVLKGCDRYETYQLQNGLMIIEDSISPGAEKSEKKEIRKIFFGYNKAGDFIGTAIPGKETGFQDVISVIYGYHPVNHKIIGYEVLESKETPGLGDKIFKDMDFVSQFLDLNVKPEIVLTKKGGKQKDNEVEAITGATISSKAVVRLLNKSLNEWKEPLENKVQSEIILKTNDQ